MFGIVIDEQGFKVEFVRLFDDGTIDSYELKRGESVVRSGWQIANGMNKPQWSGAEWIDTEPLPPQPPVEPPVDEMGILKEKVDVLTVENQEVLEYTVDLDYRIANLEMFI